VTDIAEELEKLARLHESGALTDEEFAKAKETALDRKAAEPGSSLDDPNSSLGTAANRYVNFQIVMTVVGLVIFLILFATVFAPRFNSFPRP
jgi:hypothetical protein